ncbi:ATP synthase F0 subunit B [Pseudonocardia spirodelae]|uniref:ATP synthase F0 subunit B n=1 Tax=Pseudonocardia spirodelae TaxID=3133431 RepID=A0ABU8T5P0_9PSEU
MSVSPSPSGPHRPEPVNGSSRHSQQGGADHDRHDGGDGSWFTVVLRGYDRGEVDDRLAELDHRIHDEIRRAESAEYSLSAARAQIRQLQEQLESSSQRGHDDAGFGRRVERVLQAAEEEAAELRERAADEARDVVDRAHRDAEDRRTRTEEALLGRAATLDREFTSRSTALDEREQEADRRERDLGERERTLAERLSGAREESERILAGARTDADEVLASARAEAATTLRDAERGAGDRREAVVRDVERLAALRDEVRDELTRVQRTLAAELDREPVSAALDDALFGPAAGVASLPEPGPRSGSFPPVTGSLTALAPGGDTGGSGLRSATVDEDTADDTSDEDGDDTGTGALLLGPGRRTVGEDPDSTTVGRIPPISLTSIGVLPFGDLGAGRDQARTRTDAAGGTTRTGRGPTRGPGPGRRSR